MNFPYDNITQQCLFSLIVFIPMFRVRTVQIHNHSPVTVYPCRFRIDINSLSGSFVYSYLVCIICIDDISRNFRTPHTFIAFRHRRLAYGAAAITIFISAENNRRRFRRPYFKCGFFGCIRASQIVPVVSIL